MYITINGKSHECLNNTTNVETLLQSLEIPLNTVVVEQNGEIIAAAAWSNTPVQENDVLEIVRFVGGG